MVWEENCMKQNIAVIFGGQAAEREISIITAVQMMQGYTKEEFNILPIFISSKGKWLYHPTVSNASFYASLEENPKQAQEVFVKVNDNCLYKKTWLGVSKICKIDAAVNACHGGFGESGELDGLLRMCGIPSTSASVLGMAVSMDKYITKLLCKGLKIPVVPAIELQHGEFVENKETSMQLVENEVGYPCIIKPLRQGSSIGITKVNNRQEFVEAATTAFCFDYTILVEQYIENCKEYNVAIMGNGNQEKDIVVSGIDEPIKKVDEILSFTDKYVHKQKGGFKNSKIGMSGLMRKEPLDLTDVQKLQIKQSAVQLFTNLHLLGVVRFDYLYNVKTKKWYMNEINAVPGSLAYYFFTEKNMNRTEMLERMVQNAQMQFVAEQSLKNNYDIHVV